MTSLLSAMTEQTLTLTMSAFNGSILCTGIQYEVQEVRNGMSQAAWSCCNKRSSKQSVQFTLTTEGLFRNNYQEEQIKLLVQV
jgi:hypothetical protein